MALRRSSLYLACALAGAAAFSGSQQTFARPVSQSASNSENWVGTATHAHELRADSALLGMARTTLPIHIEVALKMQNRDLLDSFVANQHNPTHFFYKETLEPADVVATFSPGSDQVQAVVAHLQASGFSNISVSANRLLVSADGTAASVQTAFQTRIADVRTGSGGAAFANVDDAKVPAALSGTVLAVLGLQTETQAHTMAVKGPDPQKGKPGGGGGGGSGVVTGHNPATFGTIYAAGSTPTASSVKVGIITEGSMTQTIADLSKFTTTNGLSAVSTLVVTVGGASSDTSGTSEWNLDSQDIVGVSGGVNQLIFYTANSLYDTALTPTYNKAVNDNVAKVINISLGECETSAYNAGTMAADDQIFAAAQAQGQTFSVSTGDSGANECGGHRGTVPSYPASSPYVTAVGGTTLSTSGTPSTTWAAETVWSGTGGSQSTVEPKPSWQTKGTAGNRSLPDLAFDADPNSGAQIYVKGALQQWGGTSLSAPLFAGTWARMLAGKNLGFAPPHLYTLPAGVYHDVTSGSNGGFSATAGWDYTTGFGSLIIGSAYSAL
ncbi:MAG TPA: S53 family serine peptidase [Rudaea sp.]|jgi:pseudomonalisin/xanthomonalisin